LRSHKKEKKRQWELVRQVQYSNNNNNNQAREGTQNQHTTQQVQQVRE
jgi:hypothetical protein